MTKHRTTTENEAARAFWARQDANERARAAAPKCDGRRRCYGRCCGYTEAMKAGAEPDDREPNSDGWY